VNDNDNVKTPNSSTSSSEC